MNHHHVDIARSSRIYIKYMFNITGGCWVSSLCLQFAKRKKKSERRWGGKINRRGKWENIEDENLARWHGWSKRDGWTVRLCLRVVQWYEFLRILQSKRTSMLSPRPHSPLEPSSWHFSTVYFDDREELRRTIFDMFSTCFRHEADKSIELWGPKRSKAEKSYHFFRKYFSISPLHFLVLWVHFVDTCTDFVFKFSPVSAKIRQKSIKLLLKKKENSSNSITYS